MTKPNDPQSARGLAAYSKAMGKKGEDADQADKAVGHFKKTLAISDAVKALGSKSLTSYDTRPGTKPATVPNSTPSSSSAPLPASGFLKTAKDNKDSSDSKYRKVAKFLVLVGVEEAAKILAKLESDQVERISREIATIRHIDPVEAEALMAEFRALLSSSGFSPAGATSGGVETARSILRGAFGPEKGDSVLKKAVPETAENPFAFLEDFQGDQVALLLKDESSSTSALILSRVSPKTAAATLAVMEGSLRIDILKRVAKMGKSLPEVIERVAAALREKARSVGRSEGETVDGRSALAEILKHSASSLGERLLDELTDADPDLGRDIKDRLYTLDDVVKAEDRAVQERLRTMEDKEIALLLKGRRPSFVEKLLSNLSATRRALVEEERTILGPVPRKDTEEVAQSFLSWFRNGRETGRILMIDDEDLVI